MMRASVAQIQYPMLPPAAALAPYLAQIDGNRWYSNRGPLLWQLEDRLHRLFGAAEHAVILMASGTAALEAAIIAHAGPGGPHRPLALMPSYTFAATAQAAIRCGYVPYFVDVDPGTWMLDPQVVAGHPALDRAGLIVPVAAFGRAPDMAGWERAQAQTATPVVVDAAASFEAFEAAGSGVESGAGSGGLISATVPAVLSLHATKVFSTAEGGALMVRDETTLRRAGQATNFGLNDARVCEMDGFNGKLSEYHAAVGLAQLDHWTARKAQVARIAGLYRDGARGADLPGQLHVAPGIAGAYALFQTDDPAPADRAGARLASAGIGHRRWYGRGLHREPVFAGCERDPLPVTERLGGGTIGLPAALDLTGAEIRGILACLSDT